MAATVRDHEQEAAAIAMVESSVQAALRDGAVVGCIVAGLRDSQDRHSAALVCRAWNDAITFTSQHLTIRSRSLLPCLAHRFSHIHALDLSRCCDQLKDQDLSLAASSFTLLTTLVIGGYPESAQTNITNAGLHYFASCCENLDHISLSFIPRVLDAGIASLTDGCKHLKSVSLDNCRGLTDAALEAISRCRNLEEFSLKGLFKFTPMGLAVIGERCRRLLRLRLELCSLNIVPALKSVAIGCPNIQEISLKSRNVELGDLVRCSSLRCLRLESDQRNAMDEIVIEITAANRNLRELCFINHFAPLGDAAVVGVVQNCPNLEKLHVEAVRLTEVALLCLRECKTLKSLALDHFKSTGQGLAEIGSCGLDLNEFSLRSGRAVQDFELQTLLHSNQFLKHLDLQCCYGPSAFGFSAIGSCHTLQSLDLSFTDVDDFSLMAIASGAKFIRQLSLVKCEEVTEIRVISRFTALESLNLDQCLFVMDEGLDHIALGCSRLIHLSLAFTKITDKGLFYLTGCTHLRSLRIPYCRNVQGPGVVAVASACTWFQLVVLSHRFRGTKIIEELKKRYCMVRLEIDDMALVPFAYDLIM